MALLVTLLSTLAGLYGAAGVALAAVGAHLAGNGALATTAADFLLFHAAALVGLCTAAAAGHGSAKILLAGAVMVATGTLLFAGHLASHALFGLVPVPLAAPFGGSLTILGWLVTATGLPLALRTPGNGS